LKILPIFIYGVLCVSQQGELRTPYYFQKSMSKTIYKAAGGFFSYRPFSLDPFYRVFGRFSS
jgi:hypothetical protein